MAIVRLELMTLCLDHGYTACTPLNSNKISIIKAVNTFLINGIWSFLGAILQQLKNEEVEKFGAIKGIMVQNDFLYVSHHNGVGRFKLHYS